MKIKVELEVELDVDAWAAEYGHPSSGVGLYAAMREALGDLKDPEQYLATPKWGGLANVKDVKVTGQF